MRTRDISRPPYSKNSRPDRIAAAFVGIVFFADKLIGGLRALGAEMSGALA